MPYGLDKLWDRNSSITYASVEGQELRNSVSHEENAVFLVRWGQELFAAWATFMLTIFKGIKTSRKQGSLRISYKIFEYEKENKNVKGWTKLTDILRATFDCTEADELYEFLLKVKESKSIKILRLKWRFGPPKNLNDVTINFDY